MNTIPKFFSQTRSAMFHCLLILFVWLSLSCPGFSCASEDSYDANPSAVVRSLREEWGPVSYAQPPGFASIFQNLERSLWPALPELYQWCIQENGVHLYKHNLAPKHHFEFVTYATDSDKHFNFLSRWDGVTYHSFAYTREGLFSNDPLRKVFPMSNKDFKVGNKQYMCGHCIDFLDTQGIETDSQGKNIISIPRISTLDPRNYIPEPLHSYWGLICRTQLVQKIRQKKGAYAQYMYYDSLPERYRPESYSPQCKNSEPAIPTGVYFVELMPQPAALKYDITSYHVGWETPALHKTPGVGENYLEKIKVGSKFFPSPLVSDLRKYSAVIAPLLPSSLDKCTGHELYHRLAHRAAYEEQSVVDKVGVICHLLRQGETSLKIAKWIAFLSAHAHELEEKNLLDPDSLEAMEKLAKQLDSEVNLVNELEAGLVVEGEGEKVGKVDVRSFLRSFLKKNEPLSEDSAEEGEESSILRTPNTSRPPQALAAASASASPAKRSLLPSSAPSKVDRSKLQVSLKKKGSLAEGEGEESSILRTPNTSRPPQALAAVSASASPAKRSPPRLAPPSPPVRAIPVDVIKGQNNAAISRVMQILKKDSTTHVHLRNLSTPSANLILEGIKSKVDADTTLGDFRSVQRRISEFTRSPTRNWDIKGVFREKGYTNAIDVTPKKGIGENTPGRISATCTPDFPSILPPPLPLRFNQCQDLCKSLSTFEKQMLLDQLTRELAVVKSEGPSVAPSSAAAATFGQEISTCAAASPPMLAFRADLTMRKPSLLDEFNAANSVQMYPDHSSTAALTPNFEKSKAQATSSTETIKKEEEKKE